MSNTINVNYMTRAYNQYQQKNAAKDQEKEDTRFADSVREKSEASGSIVGNSKIGSESAFFPVVSLPDFLFSFYFLFCAPKNYFLTYH